MMTNTLVKIDAAKRALAEADSIVELKDIRDKAEALRRYAARRGDSHKLQNEIAEIKVRSERRLGEIIPEMQARGELAAHGGDRNSRSHDATLNLSDIGLTKSQSSRWQLAAKLPETWLESYIAKTKANGRGEITSTAIHRLAKEYQRELKREENQELVESVQPLDDLAVFQTIVLDPPWDWGDEGDIDQLGRARPTYQTMSFDDVLALPVKEKTDENAHLYLWITNRSLPKGFVLLDAWGFRYITCLTWCKPHFGMGNYFRGSTEHVLFGVKGSLPLLRSDVGTWFEAARPGKHSSKPVEFYELVEICSPGPWLEMFARNERNGWVSWGAEV